MSSGFTGEHSHTLDAKGRIIMPAKFRDKLGDGIWITKGLDGCLFAYPNDEWERIENKYREVPRMTKDARRFSRNFFGSASPCDIDKQGRTLIPANLREYAGLEKEVVLVGVLNRIEIWNKDRLQDNLGSEDMDELAEGMAELGLDI